MADPTAQDRETAAAALEAAGECYFHEPRVRCRAHDGTLTPIRHCSACAAVERVATALADARREEREANCRALCAFCRGESPIVRADVRRREGCDPHFLAAWVHEFVNGDDSVPCIAAAIRARGEGA